MEKLIVSVYCVEIISSYKTNTNNFRVSTAIVEIWHTAELPR